MYSANISLGIAWRLFLCFFVKGGFAGIFPDLVRHNISVFFPNALLRFWDIFMNCLVSLMKWDWRQGSGLSRSESLMSFISPCTWLLWGFLIPIINTTFIELYTAAYLGISFSPCPILRLNFSFLCNENSQSKPIPQTVSSVDIHHASPSYNHSSENSLNGNALVFKYLSTR